MMRNALRWLGSMLLVLVAIGGVRAQDSADARWQQANEAFQHGVEQLQQLRLAKQSFERAALLYRGLHEEGLRRPGLYRNLGHAEFLADRWPQALWAYHMGRTLQPNDRVFQQHIDLLRTRVRRDGEGSPPRSANGWSGAWLPRISWPTVLVCHGAAWLGIWFWRVHAFNWARTLAWIAGVVTALTLLSAGYTSWRETQGSSAPLVIVTEENTPCLRGNGYGYASVESTPLLPAGREVTLLHRRGDWLQVRTPTRDVGWIPATKALIVDLK